MEGGYGFLLDLALILLSTKLLGLLTQRFQLPQVVGALLAGLILGPAVLNVIQETEFIKDTAEIGVIVMMFCAGMETDVNELKNSGKAAFVIALIGVLVPVRRLCPGLFLQPARRHRFGRLHAHLFAKPVHRCHPDRYLL